MNRWNDKGAFIKWVEEKKEQALNDFKNYVDAGTELLSCDSKMSISALNMDTPIEIFEKNVDEKVLAFFNDCMYNDDIELLYLDIFLGTVDNVNFFYNSGFKSSQDNDKYSDRLRELKTKAIELQYYSQTQIRIRIPIQPQVSIYEMTYHLKRLRVDNEIIKHFMKYFGKVNIQKESKAYVKRRKEWNNLATIIGKGTPESIESMSKSMHYYEPKMKQYT